MRILVLQGSPNSDGSTALLASEFARGAHEAHYDTLVRYLSFHDCGRVLGYGCGTPSMTKRSEYPRQAYLLGRGLAE